MNRVLKFIIACLLISISASGQTDEQRFVVPLSNPGKPGSLQLHMIQGGIEVKSHKGKEVIVTVSRMDEKMKYKYKSKYKNKGCDSCPDKWDGNKDQSDKRAGMKRIGNNSISMSIIEDNNFIKVNGQFHSDDYFFDILVPEEFSLNLKTVDGGNIQVSNLQGELNLNNVDGDIIVKNCKGSVVAHTVDGEIKVELLEITKDVPMAFSTVDGDIELNLPSKTKASFKIKSDWGEIFTDFDMKIVEKEPKVEKEEGKGYKKYVLDKWVYGEVNGGGPELMFKTMEGDIYIRSN